MTPGRTSQSLSLRPGGSGKWLAWGFNGVLAAMGLVFGVLGLERGRPEFVVVGVILLAPVCLVLLLQPSGELGDDALVLRVGRRHPRTVLLDDIAAVGMVYTIQPRVSAWIPYAWLRDGSAVNLPVGNTHGP